MKRKNPQKSIKKRTLKKMKKKSVDEIMASDPKSIAPGLVELLNDEG